MQKEMMMPIIIGLIFLILILTFIFSTISQYRNAKRYNAQDNFQQYREKYPDKVLHDGTVICRHCGSHKTVMYRGDKYCQTCNAFIYRTGIMKAFSLI